MTTFVWNIINMTRLATDGFVVTVDYTVNAQDGDYSSYTYGSVSYTQEPGETYIPYEQLTQEIVIGWVQESLGKDKTEAYLQDQIEAQKYPTQINGVPWSAA